MTSLKAISPPVRLRLVILDRALGQDEGPQRFGNKFPEGFDSRLYFARRAEAIPIKLDLLELISCHTLETPLRRQTEREGPLGSGGLCEAR